MKVRKGYHTFSIIWYEILYYNNKTKQLYTKDIKRGRRYLIPKAKYFGAIRGYPLDIQEHLWSFEELFGKIRIKIAHLSAAREHLKSYLKESTNGSVPPGSSETPGAGESNPRSGPGRT